MYNKIVNVLYDCSKLYLRHKNKVNNIRPGWSKYVAEYRLQEYVSMLQEACKLWVLASRPRQGPEFEYKKLTKARYKYAIYFICKNEQTLRADSIALKLLNNNNIDFWKRELSIYGISLSGTL